MLKNLIAAGALALTVGMPNAQAMPIGDVGGGDAHVILVSGGCGPYWHRGPYGGCRPGGQWGFPGGPGPGGPGGNGGISPFYGPAGGAYCPPGYHLGQYGHACWPNG
jgi:hypothetical protein